MSTSQARRRCGASNGRNAGFGSLLNWAYGNEPYMFAQYITENIV